MRKPVAITQARDNLPAQRFLLFAVVIAALALGLPGLAHGQTSGKSTHASHHRASQPPLKAGAAPTTATSVSLRAANDFAASKVKIETAREAPAGSIGARSIPTGSILGRAAGGKTVGVAAGLSASAVAPEPPLSVLPRATTREWYPESHSYLRPYRYKWRYWTPG